MEQWPWSPKNLSGTLPWTTVATVGDQQAHGGTCRTVRTPDLEEAVLDTIEEEPSSSTCTTARDLGPLAMTFCCISYRAVTHKGSVSGHMFTWTFSLVMLCRTLHSILSNFETPCIISQGLKMLGLIRYHTSSFSILDSLLVLCRIFVRSKIEYASVVWNSITITDSSELEIIQRKFAA
jgi:hypothetical protein